MQDKKSAKAMMLKQLSREMSDDAYSPMKDQLQKKKMGVSVMADSPKDLKKGLSMAEKLMQLKDKQSGKEVPEEMEEMSEDEDEAHSVSPEIEDDMAEMSEEELYDLYCKLKEKFE